MKEFRHVLNQLEGTLGYYLINKAPDLPAGFKKNLVSFIPYLSLIFLILGLPLFLAFFGISFFLLPFSFLSGPESGIVYLINLVLSAISLILLAKSIPDLFRRRAKGWSYIYWTSLIHVFINIITFNLLGLIFMIVPLYFLFQIKSYYK